ncbi:MAG: hypothetical protein E3J71_10215 [Candidatus Stahlbacteria bacterium]|nr:MAG: hypothetical protein E3J71_10215 [Candidatus Stahlbacteria bacterium]
MRGRRVICCMVGAAFAVLFFPLTLSADAGDQFIVKTTNLDALQEFAAEHGAQVSPLIFYPNPSKETMALYGDQYIVKIPAKEESEIKRTIDRIQTLPGVQSTQPDEILDIYIPEWDEEPVEGPFNSPNPPPYTPNDPRYPDQWDKPMTETNWAWNATTGEGAGVAILDGGADTTHEDLVDNLYMGWDFNENDADYYEVSGSHGTTCCGVACAKIDNALGVAGVAGDAHLMALKIFGTQPIYTTTISNAINYAIDNGVKVISMSWVATPSSALENVMANAWDRGAFLCAGVGNNNIDQPFYPAAYDMVMAVGSISSDGGRWSSSNYGDWVQIFAPGGVSTSKGGGYTNVIHTSFTGPQIAGLAALIFSAYPHATPQQVWDNIIQGADTIASDVGPILRMNSRKAVEMEIIAVEERKPEPIGLWAASVQSGVIRFTYDLHASTSYNLRIFDVTGRELYAERGRTDMKGEISCNPALGSGVYFWRFKTSEGTSSGKLVYVR